MTDAALIYLDHSATTPLRDEVREAMAPYLGSIFGNPGSIHRFGRAARAAVDEAREQVAGLINADPRHIVFTGSGTEADNLAVCGLAAASTRARKRIVVSPIEHHAVLHAAEAAAQRHGVEVAYAPVNADGCVEPGELAALIDDGTILVSVMTANNETGARQPMEAIARLCAERGVPFHTDAVQAAAYLPLDVRHQPVSLMALSAHKLNGPKGVGACYIAKGIEAAPLITGGPQERERRAGTENVAGIVGFGKACELALTERSAAAERVSALRERLEGGIIERIPSAHVNAARAERIPSITNVSFQGVEGESLLLALDTEGVAASSGAACASGSVDPSHVLLAMGLSHEAAQTSVRFSLGRFTTAEEIDRVLGILPGLVERLRTGHGPTTAR